MTTREKHAINASVERETCRWRTGDRRCAIPTVPHCSWHRYWLRVVEQGVIVQPQYEAFCEWWEQFQPYGTYANTPGIWWADQDVLWAALCGQGDVPYTTEDIYRELYLRRAEVRLYRAGKAFDRAPWARMSGPPLPEWSEQAWKAKVDGSFHNIKQCG